MVVLVSTVFMNAAIPIAAVLAVRIRFFLGGVNVGWFIKQTFKLAVDIQKNEVLDF